MAAQLKTTDIQAKLSALGDGTRYKIVKLLKEQPELCVSEVAEKVGITTAGISQHMKILEQSGLVSPQRMGQRTCYRLQINGRDSQALINLIK